MCTENGCQFHDVRLVISTRLKKEILQLIHIRHSGMQRIEQLARTVVYCHNIDANTWQLAKTCTACAEHQNKPAKSVNHSWMLPEKRWSHLHNDHAVNFLGTNWLVAVDAYSKFPCIHPTTCTLMKTIRDILDKNFSLLGNPHTTVTDNDTTFISDEFQEWRCCQWIAHLTGMLYHQSTNGHAECLVQTFMQ